MQGNRAVAVLCYCICIGALNRNAYKATCDFTFVALVHSSLIVLLAQKSGLVHAHKT